jgi:hypothetical protein
VNVTVVRINAQLEDPLVERMANVFVDEGQKAKGTDGNKRALKQFEECDEADTRVERTTRSTRDP